MNKCIVLVLILTAGGLTGCISATQTYALDYAEQVHANPRSGIGETTEHVMNLRENSYVFLDSRFTNWLQDMGEDIKGIGFEGLLINSLHLGKCRELARTWEPKNPMRKSLKRAYGDAFPAELFATPRAAFYHWTPAQNPRMTFHPKNSWVYIGPATFGKSTLDEVTPEDMRQFFDQINTTDLWRVKLRYLGTAKVNWPPSWGSINYFDLVDMQPATTAVAAQ